MNTSALKAVISAKIAAAAHSHALRQGRSPAVAGTPYQLSQHAAVLAASLEKVVDATASANATTRSRTPVRFSHTAEERSFDADAGTSGAPIRVPLKQPGTTPAVAAPEPDTGSVPSQHEPSAPRGGEATAAAAPAPKTTVPALGQRTSTRSMPDTQPAEQPNAKQAATPPAPAPAVSEAHPMRLKRKPKRRPGLQADRGDVCEESDSEVLQRRRAELEEFRKEITTRNVPSRVCRAILQSTVTLSLAELAAIAVQERLVTLLVQLAEALRDNAGGNSLDGPRHKVDAFLGNALRRVADKHANATPATAKLVANAIVTCADPRAMDQKWAKVLCTSSEWTRVPGKTSLFKIPFARMRTCTGFLASTVAQGPVRSHPQGVRVAFDEGAEMNTITKAAWSKHKADWERGHPAFSADSAIGPTHGIKLKGPVTLQNFSGDETKHNHMVLVHLRLGCACYPVYCALVDAAPAEVVLGVGFRRKHNAPYPPGYPENQGMGVTSLCLGVPPGHGLFFPKSLRRRYQDADPASVGFRQVLQLRTPYVMWGVEGKRLTPAQLTDEVSGPVP